MHLERIRRLAAPLAITLSRAGTAAAADSYPTKPVSMLVGFAPGGSADILARLVAQKLSAAMSQQFVVENKPGAGATIATTLAAKSPADGHTLLFVTSGHAGSSALYPKLAYDPLTSFTPIVEVGSTAVVIVVPAGSPYRTLTDLVDAARKQPGRLNFAAGGGGATVTALAAEYLKADAKIEMQGINYKGSGPALIALIGNEIDLAFDIPSSALPHIQSGKLRPLAVTSKARSSVMPDVPTVAEQGLPSFEVLGWFGLLAPAGTPNEVITRLNKEVAAMLGEPDSRERFKALGVEPGGGAPAEFEALIRLDTKRAGDTIRRLGLQAN